jgi:NAD(P)H-flavin reductase
VCRHADALFVGYTLTRGAPDDWAGLRGRVNPAMLSWLYGDAATDTRRAVVCGSQAMLDDVIASFRAREDLVATQHVVPLDA